MYRSHCVARYRYLSIIVGLKCDRITSSGSSSFMLLKKQEQRPEKKLASLLWCAVAIVASTI
jgi:hypothetical protein